MRTYPRANISKKKNEMPRTVVLVYETLRNCRLGLETCILAIEITELPQMPKSLCCCRFYSWEDRHFGIHELWIRPADKSEIYNESRIL